MANETEGTFVPWKRNLGSIGVTKVQNKRKDGSPFEKMLIGRSYLDKDGEWQRAHDYDAGGLFCLAILAVLAAWELLKTQGKS